MYNEMSNKLVSNVSTHFRAIFAIKSLNIVKFCMLHAVGQVDKGHMFLTTHTKGEVCQNDYIGNVA
jgi:hypothetical protein